ncbi:hypothetical protein TSUD_218790 [Trifolium subterraneum]|uniref:Uncharacterized protein n=1 Tax=Trifolium subterraneum TaxID=3900 RepID=A0A2Z6MJ72_TRISU|nr:hypothetical protein TSUD_218790 [Trifolium subterraneum]
MNSKMIEIMTGLMKLEINIASTSNPNCVEQKSGNVLPKVDAPSKKKNEASNKGKAIDVGSDDIEKANPVLRKIPNIDDISTVIISEDDKFDDNDEIKCRVAPPSYDHHIYNNNVTIPYKGPTTLELPNDAEMVKKSFHLLHHQLEHVKKGSSKLHNVFRLVTITSI